MNGNGEAHTGVLADGLVFIGATPGQNTYDRDGYLEVCRAMAKSNVRIVLTNQSFTTLPITKDYCCVLAMFRVFMNRGPASTPLRGTTGRLTFHWSLAGNEPKLMALESAFVLGVAEVNGTSTHQGDSTAPPLLDSGQGERLFEFRDDHRISHFTTTEEIVYVEAHGHKCTIHCVKDVFDVNTGITAIAARLGDGFVRLHRSYLVNPWHLRTISAKGALLDNGERLPVPARRVKELRDAFRQARKPRSEIDGLDYLL